MEINNIDDLQHIILQINECGKHIDNAIDSTNTIIDGYNKTLDILHVRLVND